MYVLKKKPTKFIKKKIERIKRKKNPQSHLEILNPLSAIGRNIREKNSTET